MGHSRESRIYYLQTENGRKSTRQRQKTPDTHTQENEAQKTNDIIF